MTQNVITLGVLLKNKIATFQLMMTLCIFVLNN